MTMLPTSLLCRLFIDILIFTLCMWDANVWSVLIVSRLACLHYPKLGLFDRSCERNVLWNFLHTNKAPIICTCKWLGRSSLCYIHAFVIACGGAFAVHAGLHGDDVMM
jgi:hypothetical protein